MARSVVAKTVLMARSVVAKTVLMERSVVAKSTPYGKIFGRRCEELLGSRGRHLEVFWWGKGWCVGVGVGVMWGKRRVMWQV